MKMKKSIIAYGLILTGIISFLIVGLVDFSQPVKDLGPISGGNANIDDSRARYEWEHNRLKDPATGEIPKNIRRKEIAFASKLPNDKQLKNVDWLARGPYNVGGRTRALKLDVTNENRILAGGVSGGMWLTEDGGQQWTRVNNPMQFPSVSCIAQDPRPGKTNIWYYGTGEIRGSGWAPGAFYYGDGLMKSIDNGLTWESVASTSSNIPQNFDSDWNFVNRVAVDPSVDTLDVVYTATYGSVFRSEDGGQNWDKKLGNNGSASYYTELAVSPTGVVFATMSSDGNDKGVWRSPDGINWTNITPWDTFPPVFERIVLKINPSNENEVFFLGETPGYGQYSVCYFDTDDWNSLWKYTYVSGNGADTGGVWNNLSMNIPNWGPAVFDNFNSQNSYNLVIDISPADPNVIVIGGTNLYVSTDGFTTQNNVNQIGGFMLHSTYPDNWDSYLNHHSDQHANVFLPSNPNVMISANDGGIFKTYNVLDSVVSWVKLNNGYNTTQAYTVGFDPSATDDIIVAGFQDNANYYVNTEDTTAQWTMPLQGDGSYMGITNGKEYYYLSINRGKIYKMQLDTGGAVLGFNRIDPMGAMEDDYLFINPLVLDQNNNDLMYVAGGRKLWRNDALSTIPLSGNYDTIATGWFAFSDTLTSTSLQISAVAVSKNPANIVWYGTTSRYFYKIEDAHTGDPQHQQMPLIGFPPANMSSIAINPENADEVIVVFSNYNVYSLYYTKNGGDTWIKGAGNLEESSNGSGSGPSLRSVSILPRPDGTLYFVGASTGLYVAHDLDSLDTEWTQIGTNYFGNVIIEMVQARETDGLVVVGTHGKGIYSTRINSVNQVFPGVSIEKETSSDIGVRLYPNPARESINFDLAKNISSAKIEILDINGKLLLSDHISTNQTKIEISSLQAGMYICRVISVNGVSTSKFVKQ